MWSLFQHHRPWPIALDLGAGSIRLLQLRRLGGRMTVTASAIWRYPTAVQAAEEPQAAPESGHACGPSQRRDMAVEAVRAMLRDHRFQGRRVVTALSTSQLCIKSVRLEGAPSLFAPLPEGLTAGDDKLRQTLLEEARARFNFDVQPDQLFAFPAGPVRQGADVRNEVILLAVHPRTIEEHLSLLADMGLTVERVDAEPVAMFRGFERFLRRAADEQAVTVVIDIGLTGTRVVVARGRQIVFIKCIDIGGRRLTEAVARQLNIRYEEACDLRVRMMRESSDAPASPEPGAPRGAGGVAWTVRDALRGEVEALAREVNLCLRYCSVTFRGLRPDRLTVIGGEAYDAGVVQALSEHLGTPCVVGQPLKGMDTSAVDLGGDRRGMLTEWSICVGLAARDADPMSWNADADVPGDRTPARAEEPADTAELATAGVGDRPARASAPIGGEGAGGRP